mgnify:FL=1
MGRNLKAEDARKNRQYQGQKCIIGLDQSYKRTGISIAVNGKLKKVSSINFQHVKTKTEKRLLLAKTLEKAIKSCLKKYPPEDIAIICERIRTYTAGYDLRPDYLKTTGALIAYIVDTAYKYGIEVYSIDTRAWKSAVLGSSKAVFPPVNGVKDPQKFGSVAYIIKLGFEENLRSKSNRNKYYMDDDMADGACIALSPFRARADKFQKEF